MLGRICTNPASTTSADPVAMRDAAFSVGVKSVGSSMTKPISRNHPFSMPMKPAYVSITGARVNFTPFSGISGDPLPCASAATLDTRRFAPTRRCTVHYPNGDFISVLPSFSPSGIKALSP